MSIIFKTIINKVEKNTCKICHENANGADICEICRAISYEVFGDESFAYEEYLRSKHKDKETEAHIESIKNRFKA